MKSSHQDVLEKIKERKKELRNLCLELFSGKNITLEIGCGHGHFLTSYSKAYPDKICVGVDLCTKRIIQCKRKKDRAALHNLHFIKADAVEFLDVLPEDILIDEVFILFPDPWPKTRHHKNRLIQGPFLELLSSKSFSATKLHFRTDHHAYFEWSTKEISKTPHWELSKDLTWPFEEVTIFQQIMGDYQSLIAQKI